MEVLLSAVHHLPPLGSRSRRGSERGAGNLLQRHPGILEWEGESNSRGSLLKFLEILKFRQTQIGKVGLPCCWGGWWLQSGKERHEPCFSPSVVPARAPLLSGLPSVQERALCVACARRNRDVCVPKANPSQLPCGEAGAHCELFLGPPPPCKV